MNANDIMMRRRCYIDPAVAHSNGSIPLEALNERNVTMGGSSNRGIPAFF